MAIKSHGRLFICFPASKYRTPRVISGRSRLWVPIGIQPSITTTILVISLFYMNLKKWSHWGIVPKSLMLESKNKRRAGSRQAL